MPTRQNTIIISHNTLVTGQKTSTAAAAAVQLDTERAIRSVVVRALDGNSGLVYVGPSGITSSTGYALEAKEAVALDVDNLNKVYLKVASDNEGVCWAAVLNE